MCHAGVQKAIDMALGRRANRLELNADLVLDQLRSDHDGARNDGEWGSAVRATELLGRHLGMFAKKFEVDVSLSLKELIEQAGNGGGDNKP